MGISRGCSGPFQGIWSFSVIGVSRLPVPGSSFGKKTQVRASLSRKDQENMIARSNRAFQTGTGPDPYPSPAPPRAAEGVSGWRS